MKKLGIFLLMAVFGMSFAMVGTAQAGNITIHDNMSHNPGDVPPPNPYKLTPSLEDETVTGGAQTGQNWDMEAFGYNPVNAQLDLVGGYNWLTGQDGFKTGDVFIALGYKQNYGRFITSAADIQTQNTLWNYNYVVTFERDTANNIVDLDSDGIEYTILKVGPNALFQNISSNSAPLEGQKHSNPYRYVSGGESVGGGFISWSPGLTDAQVQALGYNVIGGSHNILDVSLASILADLDDLPANELLFTSHVTMSCGNDSLSGYHGGDGAVPLPGAVLLMGAGLARLVAYSRRRNQTT